LIATTAIGRTTKRRTPNFTTLNDQTPNSSNEERPNAEFYNIETPEYRILYAGLTGKLQLASAVGPPRVRA
jgi:hypothetical protein